jgi:hypothetical protein
MVTSTIMKDTGGSTDAIFRPNAIRALCRIIDVCALTDWPCCPYPLGEADPFSSRPPLSSPSSVS